MTNAREGGLTATELTSSESDRLLAGILSEVEEAFPDVSIERVEPTTGKIVFEDEPLVNFGPEQRAALADFEKRLREVYLLGGVKGGETEEITHVLTDADDEEVSEDGN